MINVFNIPYVVSSRHYVACYMLFMCISVCLSSNIQSFDAVDDNIMLVAACRSAAFVVSPIDIEVSEIAVSVGVGRYEDKFGMSFLMHYRASASTIICICLGWPFSAEKDNVMVSVSLGISAGSFQ